MSVAAAIFWLGIFTLIVLFAGEPDLHAVLLESMRCK
jgi:hypothetical protein